MSDGTDEGEVAGGAAAHDSHEHEIHMPPNSIWPLGTAVGLTLTMLGLVTIWSFWPLFVLGLLILVGGVAMWVRDARQEYSELH